MAKSSTPPDLIKVGPYEIRLVFDRKLLDPHTDGSFDPVELLITIADDIPLLVQKTVLLHEILHACYWLDTYRIERKSEEHVIQGLTVNLFGILRENQEMTRWLTE